ncbi:MAG: glycosyltransferase family 4 protein [Treponema sp.]|nr:glycosyltransferase family 4 protein [Treponema sp.]
MKIAIDTLGGDHGKSGFGSYIYYFISNLPSGSQYEIELFGTEEDRYTYTSGTDIPYSAIKLLETPKALRRWYKYYANRFIKKHGYDIVLYPSASKMLPSHFCHHKAIAIINSIMSSEMADKSCKEKRQLKKGIHNAHKIIAASRFIKDDLVKLGIAEEKISVIHNGIDHKLFFPMADLFEGEIVDVKPFAIKRPYFIYGSSLSSPEKKHIELIHAFELFKKNTGFPHRLVLAGNDGPYAEAIHKAAFDSPYASDIFLTGFFPHENFARLYAGAEACVFPSVNEGVGLPILEAMACGIPVLCSEKAALKEIGGTAPLYFDSDDIDNIATSLQKIVEDSELRENMITDSIMWANEFNWEETVKKTLSILL